jgi:hypothetical protein
VTEVIYQKKVKCRKKHTCWGCLKNISVGETATRQTIKEDGVIYSGYSCDICEEVLSKMHWFDIENIREGELPDTDEWQNVVKKSRAGFNGGVLT